MSENNKINITFPDGSKKEFESGILPMQIAEGISHGLAKRTLAAKVNDNVVALNHPIKENSSLQLLTFNENEGRDLFWHSSAHLMAQAIKRLYPEAQLGIGPPVDDGFYYDIDLDTKLSPEDFDAIEAEMLKIVEENLEVHRAEFADNDEAIKFFKEKNENLKVELIQEFEEAISAYSQGEFTDLCRGPHIVTTDLWNQLS